MLDLVKVPRELKVEPELRLHTEEARKSERLVQPRR
jgi:hypothetical protein